MINKNPQELLALIEAAKLFKPVVSEILDELLDAYGPELAKVSVRFRDFTVAQTVETIKQYEAAGLSHEEAVAFTMNDRQNLREAIRNVKMSK